MAIQKGLIKLAGKLGELVFYQRKQQHVVKQKAKSYPLSEATQQVGKDFGEASRHASYVRKAFAKGVALYGDDGLINRLNKCFIDIFKTIPKAQQGKKKLIDGKLSLLKGFEFNEATPLHKLLYQLPVCDLQADGLLKISLPQLPQKKLIKKIRIAETCVIRLMVFNFALDGDGYEIIQIKPLSFNLLEPNFQGASLKFELELKGDRALVMAMGISYLMDGAALSKDQRYRACQVIEALHLKDGHVVTFVDAEAPAPNNEADTAEDGLSWEMGEG